MQETSEHSHQRSRRWWSTIINELEFEDKKLTDPTEIAEGFNKFFAEIGPKLSENIEDIDICFDEFVNQSSTNKSISGFVSLT